MTNNTPENFSDFIELRNSQKKIFTAGPSSLIKENLTDLRPCFGRGDRDYTLLENSVLNIIKNISGHKEIVRLQGSASLALEIISVNFLYGKVLIVSTGFYSERLIKLVKNAKKIIGEITKIKVINIEDIDQITGRFDWIVSCYTETSRGFKISLEKLRDKADSLKSKIMLDATASIGLEENHHLADVMGFSSCKGLFGLTGAAFITYNVSPSNKVNSFYLDISSHINKEMTGPYHAICSLHSVLKNHEIYKKTVAINKNNFLDKFKKYINLPQENQPLLCTYISTSIMSKDDRVILYKPRDLSKGSIVCHLGEAHLTEKSNGEINNFLEISN